jgi:hypothetical protein
VDHFKRKQSITGGSEMKKKLTMNQLLFPLYDVPPELCKTARAWYRRECGYLRALRAGVPAHAILLIHLGAQDYRAVPLETRQAWERFYNERMGITPTILQIPEELLDGTQHATQ